MNILFVSSGNSESFDISPIIKSQGESLRDAGFNVDYFTITEKRVLGYLKNARRLRKCMKDKHYDIIHTHYTLSGWTAVLAFPKQPIVLSLMGTDAYGEYVGVNRKNIFKSYLTLLTYFIQPFVDTIVSKSKTIECYVYKKKRSYVLPNGVPLEKIKCYDKGYKDELNLIEDSRHVLFLGNRSNKRKNYKLLKEAFDKINIPNVKLITPYPITHEQVIKYLNSVDVLVVPSLQEGSPNLIKEAMACNCPVVATNVGDVEWLFGNEPGYYIADFDPHDMADKIKQAINYSEHRGRTNGRGRIVELGLDTRTVANKLINIYQMTLNGTATGHL